MTDPTRHPILAFADVPWPSIAMMAAGLLVLAWVLVQYRRRGDATRPVSRPPSARQTLHEVMRDAEELAQRLAAELDARAERLEQLIAAADDRLRRLERADGSTDLREAKAAPRRPPIVVPADGPGDPLNRQIYALADEGLTPVDIAQRLEQPTGKVELILALRGR